jgi:hypothetical protein
MSNMPWKHNKQKIRNLSKIKQIFDLSYSMSLKESRICKSKDRQYNDQKKKYKRTNNNLHNIHKKLKIELHEPH